EEAPGDGRGTPRGRFELPGSFAHGVAGGRRSPIPAPRPTGLGDVGSRFAFGGSYLRARPGNARASETRRHAAGCVIANTSPNREGRARDRFSSWSFTITVAHDSGSPVTSSPAQSGRPSRPRRDHRPRG